jgi:hypothetical protein
LGGSRKQFIHSLWEATEKSIMDGFEAWVRGGRDKAAVEEEVE